MGIFADCTPLLKVGDLVRLKNGSATLRVTRTFLDSSDRRLIDAEYLLSSHVLCARNEKNFALIHEEKKMTTDNKKLYQFKDKISEVDLYGHYLATNSQGEWVMEVKGSGTIIAIPKGEVTEVLPHTIGVQFEDGGTTYSYLAEKDKFQVGFYMVHNKSKTGWQIVRVVAVDTKSDKATTEFSPIGKLPVDLF